MFIMQFIIYTWLDVKMCLPRFPAHYPIIQYKIALCCIIICMYYVYNNQDWINKFTVVVFIIRMFEVIWSFWLNYYIFIDLIDCWFSILIAYVYKPNNWSSTFSENDLFCMIEIYNLIDVEWDLIEFTSGNWFYLILMYLLCMYVCMSMRYNPKDRIFMGCHCICLYEYKKQIIFNYKNYVFRNIPFLI